MRLRFTIRDLLWLAALVAVCVAWWLDHRHASESYADLEKSPTVAKLRAAEAAYEKLRLLYEQMYTQHALLILQNKTSEKNGNSGSNDIIGR